jgi:mono/diheme cytochrome c family protein
MMAMAGRFVALMGFIALAVVSTSGCAHGGGSAASSSATATPPVIGNESRGAEIFRANCAVCHTATGAAAGVGPSLAHEKQRKNYNQTVAWIEQPDPPMPKLNPSPLSERDVDDVAAYVQSL